MFLASGVVLVLIGALKAGPWDIASSAGFVSNYSPAAKASWLEHTWSLSVEEQFYLVWPLLLIKVSGKRILTITAALITCGPVFRILQHLATSTVDWHHFQNRVDSLLIGSGLALLSSLRPSLVTQIRIAIQRHHLALFACAVLLLTTYASELAGGYWALTLATPLNSFAAAVLIIRATDDVPNRVSRALEFRPLVWLGLISFSVYLWQQLFMLPNSPLPLGIGFPLMLAIASLSYLLVEKPLVRLKDRRHNKLEERQNVPL